jgi:glycerate 2-kinase
MSGGRPLRVIVAPDSFKGSLDAGAVADAIGAGVREVYPDATLISSPVADGGEGLLDILLPVLGGKMHSSRVAGPLPGQMVEAAWGYVEQERLAIVEMARAAGLLLVPPDRRDPRITTSFGFGELIRAGLDAGAQRFLVGIGGTATNDGGAGLAQALGVHLLNGLGMPVGRGGIALSQLAQIDMSDVDPRLAGVTVTVASDVGSPLTGPRGASQMYGPQKGATPAMVEELDRCLENFRQVILRTTGTDVQEIPGSGAAGGAGAALAVFCRAGIRLGIDVVLDAIRFDERIEGADLVITGEGRLDDQTNAGKAMAGVRSRAHARGVRVAAVVGSVQGDAGRFQGSEGFAAVCPLVEGTITTEAAIRDAARLIRMRSAQLMRTLHFSGGQA